MSKSRDIADSAATINYIDTVTSNVQDQIDNLDPVPTNIAGGSAGTIPYQSAADTTAMLAVGTAGQVLQTNGAGAPSWVTPAGGAMVFLSEIIASSVATADIETTFDSTYNNYVIMCSNITTSATTQIHGRLKVSGAYVTTATHAYHQHASNSESTGYLAQANTSDTSFRMVDALVAGSPNVANLDIFLSHPSETSNRKSIRWNGYSWDGAGKIATSNGVGGNSGTGAYTGFRLYPATGTFSGTFRLYGIVKS